MQPPFASHEPVAALTAREIECLKRIFDLQTAKEMGRDLGISHHAVEKRLKSARQKLGVQTSTEAARRAAIHYGWTASGLPDLAEQEADAHSAPDVATDRVGRTTKAGVIAMMISLISAAALYAMAANEPDTFANLDKNRNGFIEKSEFANPEMKVRTFKLGTDGSPKMVEASKQVKVEIVSHSFAQFDKNGDGRISRAEFGDGDALVKRVSAGD